MLVMKGTELTEGGKKNAYGRIDRYVSLFVHIRAVLHKNE